MSAAKEPAAISISTQDGSCSGGALYKYGLFFEPVFIQGSLYHICANSILKNL